MHKRSKSFYHSKAWKKARMARLMLDHFQCTECYPRFLRGEIRKAPKATMVHHEVPLEANPDLALDLENLRSLCDACHNKKHPEKGARGAGKPVSTKHRARIIKL